MTKEEYKAQKALGNILVWETQIHIPLKMEFVVSAWINMEGLITWKDTDAQKVLEDLPKEKLVELIYKSFNNTIKSFDRDMIEELAQNYTGFFQDADNINFIENEYIVAELMDGDDEDPNDDILKLLLSE